MEWTQASGEFPPYRLDGNIIAKIEEAAAAHGKNTAVNGPDGEMSYAELNEQANGWAHFIQSRGIGKGDIVGICVERSAAMIVASLGAMKAGAAYLPIDPTYPAERILYSLADADASLLLTQRHLQSMFQQSPAEVVVIDDGKPIDEMPITNLAQKPGAQDPAYVIYTSGSTGRPKGVLISHRSLLNLVLWHQSKYQVTSRDRASQIASPSFDASVWEIWPYLSAGASIVIVDEDTRLMPDRIKSWFAEHSITIGFLPTALAELVIHENWPDNTALRALLVGGDRLMRRPAQANRFRVINHYGPTEATVVTTAGDVASHDEQNRIPAIGKPIANCTVYVLDAALAPVPVGAPGELYIGGEGVAIGYVHDPDPANPRFIANPFGQGRLYRTGDLARFLPDGQIDFIGRTDEQIKIRGYRIELAEIKSVIEEQPSIAECAVMVDEGEKGKHIVAYLAPRQGETLDIDSLRSVLRQRLPQYMIPAVFVPLARLPLTPNGKLDRTQLGALKQTAVSAPRMVPQGPTEEALAEIWQNILEIRDVSAGDNFFDIGGNSLLAIQVANEAGRRGLSLKVRDLFRHQTLRELAAIAKPVAAQQILSTVISQTQWPTTPIQGWFFEHKFVNPALWNAAMLFQIQDPIDLHRFRVAIGRLFERHAGLNLQFGQASNTWVQYPAGEDEEEIFQVFDLSGFEPAEQKRQMQAIGNRLNRSFAFGKGKLVRFAVFDLGKQGSRFLIVAHHLVCDGMSLGILVNDLTSEYLSLSEGGPAAMAGKQERDVRFIDWAVRVNSEAAIQRSLAELPYWSARDAAPIPLDFPRGDNTSDSIQFRHIEIEADKSAKLMALAHKKYRAGIDVILLWAAGSAIMEWLQRNSLVLCMVGHGRETGWDDLDLSHTVGFCNVHYPLHLELPSGIVPAEGVAAATRQLDLVPNHGIGYGVLRFIYNLRQNVEKVQLQPEPEIGFNYLGNFDVLYNQKNLFSVAGENAGSGRDPKCRFPYKMSVFSYVLNGKVQANWIFSTNQYRAQTIDRLCADFKKNLHQLVATSAAAHAEAAAGIPA
jgi:amino acid adenylation domain-containing protein/non-ribosomal peptide synthase protein (TIGR01720 family)